MTNQIVYKPWGYYQILLSEPGYLVKKLVIDPGHRISLQIHKHRTEYWTIVQANKATLTLSALPPMELDKTEEFPIGKGDQWTIDKGEIHRLSCQGPDPLVLIEVQMGDILDENDIERLEDDYQRIKYPIYKKEDGL